MVAISSAAILRLSAAAAMPYASVERMTRPLIQEDRWPSRKRREMLASDLASLLNAMMGQTPTDAAEANQLLSGLEYKSSWPTTEKTPYFGQSTWGELLEWLIAGAPSVADGFEHSRSDEGVNLPALPHIIEACLNPLSIQLIWYATDGLSQQRVDFYGPTRADMIKRYRPYGSANLLAFKSFMRPELIQIASEILQDNSPHTTVASHDAAPENENAALAGAASTRNQDQNSIIPGANTPELKRESESSQALSSRGTGASRKIHRRTRHDDADRTSPPPV